MKNITMSMRTWREVRNFAWHRPHNSKLIEIAGSCLCMTIQSSGGEVEQQI